MVHKETPEANYLPNGALLTVLENVVKHNSATDGNAIQTKIFIEESQVIVSNSKVNGSQKGSFSGTGLSNLRKRYELLSNREITIEESKETFDIRLPLLKLIP